jgi:hypothetical protein
MTNRGFRMSSQRVGKNHAASKTAQATSVETRLLAASVFTQGLTSEFNIQSAYFCALMKELID